VATEAVPVQEDESSASLDIRRVNEPGQAVELASILVIGKVTVVDFYADWCKPCKIVESKLRRVMAGEQRIALRKIHVGDLEDSPVARQHGVRGIPHVLIFDAGGELRYTLIGVKAKQAPELAIHLAR